MSKLHALFDICIDRRKRFYFLASKGFYAGLPESEYLKKLYQLKVGKELDLENPQRFTEKIQWLKLYDRNPVYTKMQDKYLVREIIEKKIGSQYMIPLLGVWDRVEDIDFDQLPEQFVLKCNHDCASAVICRDKASLDIKAAKAKLKQCLERVYGASGIEWAYRDIPRKIIAEKYMQNGDELTLTDHKFYCFDGEVKMVMLTSGTAHTDERRRVTLDPQFRRIPVCKKNDVNSPEPYEVPKCLDEMIALVEKIAEGIPFVRVDFYVIGGHPYFGEVAFYPDGGFIEFAPTEWEQKLGEWIQLPEKRM
ncbi:MAG: ATP-grasp fold amidoligase family protein [Eubacteriales bacterium]|nr:ATP-grasp fold amidoligase family protein [Eubacteriales bacterium]